MTRFNLIKTVPREQNRANTLGQYHYHSVHKQAGWFNSTIGRNSETYTSRGNGHECVTSGLVSFGGSELESGPVVASKLHIRVETPSKFVRNVGSVLGSSSYRQIRINDDNSSPCLQQLVLGPHVFGRRWSGTERLDLCEQLRKCAVRASSPRARSDKGPEGHGNSNRPMVGRADLVRDIKINAHRQSHTSSNVTANSDQNRPQSRTVQKQKMETLRLDTLWTTRLRCLGWSKRSAIQSLLSLSQSTIKTYNSYILKYIEFCESKDTDFSDENNICVISEFLSCLGNQSNRPESMLKGT